MTALLIWLAVGYAVVLLGQLLALRYAWPRMEYHCASFLYVMESLVISALAVRLLLALRDSFIG